MPKPYEFLLFDFVNTLFMPDPSRVPTVDVDGKQVVSTAGVLRERMPETFGKLEVRTIYQAHRDAWRWVEQQRGLEHREIEASVRFRYFLSLLGIQDADDGLVLEAVELHMGIVTGAFQLPREHKDLLDRLRRRHRLGILSNFDHAPPLRALLEAHGIAEWFESVVISAEIGCRKPSSKAFGAALSGCNTPLSAVLHVGDTWVADVEGARAAAIDVAWINLTGEPLPKEHQATFVIERLTQLETLLTG